MIHVDFRIGNLGLFMDQRTWDIPFFQHILRTSGLLPLCMFVEEEARIP